MGFSVKRINKYVRWVKNTAENYKTDKGKVGKEYAGLCLKRNVALLLQKPGLIDKTSAAKHDWVLSYMEKACAETVKKYRDMPAPANVYFFTAITVAFATIFCYNTFVIPLWIFLIQRRFLF